MLGLGLAAAVAPWVSYPAILMGAGLLAALGLAAIVERDRARFLALLPVAIVWAASAAAAVAWARTTVTPDDALYMQRFWARSLMPWPPQSLRDLGWPVGRLTTVYAGGGLRYPAPGVFLVLAALGAWGLWRRARDLAWLLLGPIFATLGAALLQVYPFAPRLVLFLFPAFLLLTAAGVEAVGTLARQGRAWRGWRAVGIAAVVCATLAVAGLVRDPPPYEPEPLKRALREMRDAWQPGDRVYVYYGAEKAFVYYARRYGFAPGSYVLGRCAREDPRLYLQELDAFRGSPRVWLVMAHPALGEDAIILGYLDRIGTRWRSFQAAGREPGSRVPDLARAELYDLSDPARLAALTADQAQLPPRPLAGRAAAWSCHPGA
jgi:hypothetical protein